MGGGEAITHTRKNLHQERKGSDMERYIPQRKQKKQKEYKGMKPGLYPAVVTSVVPSAGYVQGQSIDISYDVSVGGCSVAYTERYHIVNQNSPRTQALEDFLDSIGATSYDDLVGLKLELDFQYEVKNDRRWCNIVNRRLLTEVNDHDGSC